MTSFNGWIFKSITRLGHNYWVFHNRFRTFFHANKSIFDVLFLLIYTLEQLGLFVFSIYFNAHVILITGLSILFILTTLSIDKICMESRYKELERTQHQQEVHITKLETYLEASMKDKKELIKMFDNYIGDTAADLEEFEYDNSPRKAKKKR